MDDKDHEAVIPLEDIDGGCFSGPFVGPEAVVEHLRSPVKDKNARYYNMNHENRGKAVIFNHQKFDEEHLDKRTGTDVDCEKLYNCLKKLGFDIDVQHNLKVEQLKKKIKEIAKMDHTNNDCLVIVILSHGEQGYIHAYDGAYKIEQITQKLNCSNCPSLAGKPKILIIQACQGARCDDGAIFECQIDGSHCSNVPIYKVPSNADFLIVNSTIPEYVSFRNKQKGSWFIQELTAELEENAYEEDLVTLLTFANRRLALEHESDNPKLKGKKQISCITSMLTRLIKFSPKRSADDDSVIVADDNSVTVNKLKSKK